jgi:hypothetical protein
MENYKIISPLIGKKCQAKVARLAIYSFETLNFGHRKGRSTLS